MADRRAVNKYYPPDWDPSKGSVNKLSHKHTLRQRAKKIDQGILVVRFELPFNIWCLKCNNHIAMGVRYNAEKSRAGSYYTSPIYNFKMKCHLCDNHFEIRTDPAKFDYVVISGARRQIRQSPEEDLEEKNAVVSTSNQTSEAMNRLERQVDIKTQSQSDEISLRDIKQWASRSKDSFELNKLVRSQYREKRKHHASQRAKDKEFLKRHSLAIKLVEPHIDDAKAAKAIVKSTLELRRASDDVRKSQLKNTDLSSITIDRCKPHSTRTPKSIRRTTQIKRDPG